MFELDRNKISYKKIHFPCYFYDKEIAVLFCEVPGKNQLWTNYVGVPPVILNLIILNVKLGSYGLFWFNIITLSK